MYRKRADYTRRGMCIPFSTASVRADGAEVVNRWMDFFQLLCASTSFSQHHFCRATAGFGRRLRMGGGERAPYEAVPPLSPSQRTARGDRHQRQGKGVQGGFGWSGTHRGSKSHTRLHGGQPAENYRSRRRDSMTRVVAQPPSKLHNPLPSLFELLSSVRIVLGGGE